PYSCIQEIDPSRFGAVGLKRFLIPAIWLILSVPLLSCGGSSSSNGTKTSGLAYRAFVSSNVSSTTSSAGIYIVDANQDMHPLGLGPINVGSAPSIMVVTPNRAQTLVFSGNSNCSPTPPSLPCQLTIVNNGAESSSAQIPLPGPTESFIVSPDSSVAYVAVPNAPVVEQPEGAIELYEVFGTSAGTTEGQIDIPSVQYLSINNSGDRILAFSANSDSIAVVTPSNLGTIYPVVTYVGGFDRPVQAFFSSDDSTAYVVNCGAECGGNQASVQQFNMTNNTLGGYVPACIPVPDSNPTQCAGPAAGSFALVNGSTMYLAGTPYANGQPSQPCTGETTAAQTCGLLFTIDLSSIDLPSMAVTGSVVITDGYHNRMAMGANGQLFIGARTCTEIIPPVPPPLGAEVRGCLSIYNTQTVAVGTVQAGGVVIPPENGDVTGIQPIATRSVIYVVQGYPVPGGSLYIYCATTDDNINCPAADGLQAVPSNEPSYAPLMVGNFYDVKTVDF
ncbi:MAG: hypothetical protein WCC04_04055, partial [Terriglobales bacterium]